MVLALKFQALERRLFNELDTRMEMVSAESRPTASRTPELLSAVAETGRISPL
jgi:hypothetical protein